MKDNLKFKKSNDGLLGVAEFLAVLLLGYLVSYLLAHLVQGIAKEIQVGVMIGVVITYYLFRLNTIRRKSDELDRKLVPLAEFLITKDAILAPNYPESVTEIKTWANEVVNHESTLSAFAQIQVGEDHISDALIICAKNDLALIAQAKVLGAIITKVSRRNMASLTNISLPKDCVVYRVVWD